MTHGDGRKEPQPDLCSAAKRSLFDYLIGSSEQRLRDREAERFSGLKVDDQFEFGRLAGRRWRLMLCPLAAFPRPGRSSIGNGSRLRDM
jgi:hypothetical protein